MSDLISRQAVIAEFNCCELTPDGGIDANYAIEFLEQLPTAQPEVETQMSLADCISRQDALDAIDRITRTDNWQAAVSMALLDLPSAQPEKRTEKRAETHACDCISRQAAIDAARDWYEGLICGSFKGLEKRLRALPSAQPKTGKWIPTQNPQWKAYYHDKCSVCGWWNTKNAVCRDSKKKAHSLNYCPNCGAKMKDGEGHEAD